LRCHFTVVDILDTFFEADIPIDGSFSALLPIGEHASAIDIRAALQQNMAINGQVFDTDQYLTLDRTEQSL
jgi:hypothetical protein